MGLEVWPGLEVFECSGGEVEWRVGSCELRKRTNGVRWVGVTEAKEMDVCWVNHGGSASLCLGP